MTDRWTNQQTDGQTNGRTTPLIELQFATNKRLVTSYVQYGLRDARKVGSLNLFIIGDDGLLQVRYGFSERRAKGSRAAGLSDVEADKMTEQKLYQVKQAYEALQGDSDLLFDLRNCAS